MNARFLRRGALFGALALVAFGLAIVAAACNGDDDDDTATTPIPVATVGKLTILDPWVRTTTNDVTAAYFTVKNSGPADTLVAVKTSISPMAQIHEMVTSGATSSMQEMPNGLDVPANGEVTLKPGGYHVMIMNVKSALKEGDSVDLELTFKNAGTVKLTAHVQKGEAMSGMDMGK